MVFACAQVARIVKLLGRRAWTFSAAMRKCSTALNTATHEANPAKIATAQKQAGDLQSSTKDLLFNLQQQKEVRGKELQKRLKLRNFRKTTKTWMTIQLLFSGPKVSIGHEPAVFIKCVESKAAPFSV